MDLLERTVMKAGELLGASDQSDIDLSLFQKLKCLIGGLTGNGDAHLGIGLDIRFQIGHQHIVA